LEVVESPLAQDFESAVLEIEEKAGGAEKPIAHSIQ
jgi:hypothetical protein